MPAPSLSGALERLAPRSGVLEGTIVNRAPVPFVGRRANVLDGAGYFRQDAGPAAGLEGYGSDAMLFSIVSGSAETTSQVKWTLYRKAASGKTEDRTEVPRGQHASQLVWYRPNPFFTGQEFREAGMQHFELTGEWFWVMDMTAGFPQEIWPVRPDRMVPVKSPQDYLTGWTYVFDGQEIPLTLQQVIMIRRPSPVDMYRGMAPFIAGMRDVDTNKLAAEWSRQFFYNNAQPGGMIEYERRLTDQEFNETLLRWREQHRGVNNAHRVGIIEGGKWIANSFSPKDIDFSALRGVSSEQVRLAYRFPKPILGTVEDVNRANAEAAQFVYGEWFVTPRLERIKGALNEEFLPLFGPRDADLYEWDYESPTPSDRAADAAEWVAKANAAQTFINIGYDHADVEKYLDLPEMKWEKPEPVMPALQLHGLPGQGDSKSGDGPKPPAKPKPPPDARRLWLPRGADDVPPDELPSLEDTQRSWSEALAALLVAWAAVTATQVAALVELARAVAHAGDIAAAVTVVLARAEVDQPAADVLLPAMRDLANAAVREIIAEAHAQGVELPHVVPDPVRMAQQANAYADLAGRELSTSAAAETTRLYRPNISADELEQGVRDHLESLADTRQRLYLGAALTSAQGSARLSTLAAGPVTAYYANETLDTNTCGPCAEVNGRWLGNDVLKDVLPLYPDGARYVDCLGRFRCRGMVSAVWRPGGNA